MSIAHLLEDFDLNSLVAGRMHLVNEDMLEDHRLTAFEQGYAAGWDDAISAQSDEQQRISGALTKNLEDLSFTYQEALTQMTVSLEPMFTSLIGKVFPVALEQSYGAHIVEQLTDMAREQVAQPALLIVPPGISSALKPVLNREFSFPIQLVEETSLPPGQACLRVGTAERDLNCDALLESISEAMSAFLQQAKEVAQNE
ncbi:MAG: ABC transporter ATP-binding protein [Pseudomonadota bacterium]